MPGGNKKVKVYVTFLLLLRIKGLTDLSQGSQPIDLGIFSKFFV